MPANLARLLGKPEKEVAEFIAQMEDKYCYPNHDLRLLGEISQAVKQKIIAMGLDSNDTTAEELYHGLLAKFDRDSLLVDRALGVSPDTDFDSRLARAIDITKRVVGDREVWALKPLVAKKLLRDHPPKKLAKFLRYRSVESMLKREDIGQLYLLLPQLESNSRLVNLSKTVAHLPSSDYGLLAINFVRLPADKIEAAVAPLDHNICNKLTASVGLWPDKTLAKSPVIMLAMLLIQSVQKLDVSTPTESLLSVHPALAWWSNMKYLISADKHEPVSLNIHDVAHNHRCGLTHELGNSVHAAKALWAELERRYQALNDEIGESVQNEVANLVPVQLAAEYQEA